MKSPNTFSDLDIKTKIFVSNLLLIFVIMGGVTWLGIENDRVQAEGYLRNKSLTLVKGLEAPIQAAVRGGDATLLAQVGRGLTSNAIPDNDLIGVAFFDARMTKLAESNTPDPTVTPEGPPERLTPRSGMDIQRALRSPENGETYGFIRMTYSTGIVTARRSVIIRENLILTLILAFLGLGLGNILARFINAPLKTLADAAQRVAKGDLQQRLEPSHQDELGSLIRSFNQMTESINLHLEELRRKNAQLDRKVFELSTLHQAGRIINSVLNLDHLYEVIVDTTIQILGGVKRCSLMLATPATQEFVIKIAKGLDVGVLPSSRRVPIGRGIAGKVYATGEPVLINDLKEDDTGVKLEGSAVVRSSLCVPLRVNDEVVGIISAGNKISGEPFGGDDLNLLETLATQAGIAIKNARLYQDLDRKIFELATLHEVGKSLSMVLDLERLLELILEMTTRVLGGVRAGSLILFDETTGLLHVKMFKGMNREVTPGPIKIGEGIAGKVYERGEPMLINNIKTENATDPVSGNVAKSSLCVPLKIKELKLGVLSVSDKLSGESFDENDLDMLVTLASQISITLNNAKLYEELEASYLAAVRALANSLDAKDAYTAGHSERVAWYSVEIGKMMKLNPPDVKNLHIGALLHDIGKIGISENIINKSSRLTEEEFQLIKTHPGRGASIIEPAKFLKEKIPLIKYHHERYDGKGYPEGLAGEMIPKLARIVCVADSYDAMTSKRAYRDNIGRAAAVSELTRCSGTQFDPNVVAAFLEVLKDESKLAEMEKTIHT
ncbi:MAG: GAF domain-containing protein [Candidatus Ozemobacteraceae bacterium]